MKNPRGLAAALTALAVSGFLFVPYCGVLFDCGCTWPWAGFTSECNVHDERSPVHCPWCSSRLAGTLSFVLAGAAGAVVAYRGDARSRGGGQGGGGAGTAGGAGRTATRRPVRGDPAGEPRPARMDFVVRTLAGVGAFLVVAGVAGWITALISGYPKFLLW
jgi:hypothetical protein